MAERTDPLFGSMMWGGTFKGMPACVGSYNNGASLYVYQDKKWISYAKGGCLKDVIPHACSECGAQLPMPTEQN